MSDATAMTSRRAVLALLLCGTAARAAGIEPLITRPITLPQGKVDLTLQGTYTSWSYGLFGLTRPGSFDGETLALGVDVGATDRVQVGLGVALPVHPSASFGSVLATALFLAEPTFAMRLDGGYERVGVNGDPTQVNVSHTNRYFGALGANIKIPITEAIAFVTGQNGAVQFGHFQNVGDSAGLYFGATAFTQASSDFLVISGGGGSSTIVGINLPAGLLVQPDPRVAITLQAGYSAVFLTSGVTGTLHFVPLALEAVVTPAPPLDIGARFSLGGYVGASGDDRVSLNASYFDLRAVMVWLRVHV